MTLLSNNVLQTTSTRSCIGFWQPRRCRWTGQSTEHPRIGPSKTETRCQAQTCKLSSIPVRHFWEVCSDCRKRGTYAQFCQVHNAALCHQCDSILSAPRNCQCCDRKIQNGKEASRFHFVGQGWRRPPQDGAEGLVESHVQSLPQPEAGRHFQDAEQPPRAATRREPGGRRCLGRTSECHRRWSDHWPRGLNFLSFSKPAVRRCVPVPP